MSEIFLSLVQQPLSIGIEKAEDLIAALEAAFEAVKE